MKQFLINWLIGILTCSVFFLILCGIAAVVNWLATKFSYFPVFYIVALFVVASFYFAGLIGDMREGDLNEKDNQ